MKFFVYKHSRVAFLGLVLLIFPLSQCGVNTRTSFFQSENTPSSDYLLNPGTPNTGNAFDWSPPALPTTTNSWGTDLIEDPEDLLERESEEDTETYDIEYIYAEEGGELEAGESNIDIPEYALPQDTLMIFYVPSSSFIEYWVYPAGISFNDSVELVLSYQSAYLGGIDETAISIVQWLPQLQVWEDMGGVVDTLNNKVTLRVLEFAPPIEDTTYARYALADHN